MYQLRPSKESTLSTHHRDVYEVPAADERYSGGRSLGSPPYKKCMSSKMKMTCFRVDEKRENVVYNILMVHSGLFLSRALLILS